MDVESYNFFIHPVNFAAHVAKIHTPCTLNLLIQDNSRKIYHLLYSCFSIREINFWDVSYELLEANYCHAVTTVLHCRLFAIINSLPPHADVEPTSLIPNYDTTIVCMLWIVNSSMLMAQKRTIVRTCFFTCLSSYYRYHCRSMIETTGN